MLYLLERTAKTMVPSVGIVLALLVAIDHLQAAFPFPGALDLAPAIAMAAWVWVAALALAGFALSDVGVEFGVAAFIAAAATGFFYLPARFNPCWILFVPLIILLTSALMHYADALYRRLAD